MRQGSDPPPTASRSVPGRDLFVGPVSKNRALHVPRAHTRGQRGTHAERAQGAEAGEDLVTLRCLPLRAKYRLLDENSPSPVSDWDAATDRTTSRAANTGSSVSPHPHTLIERSHG